MQSEGFALRHLTAKQERLRYNDTVLTVLLAAAAGACLIPARRATRIAPVEALRHD